MTFDGQTSVYVRLPATLMGVLGAPIGCISDLLNAPIPLILIYTGHVILVSGRRRENRHFASWYTPLSSSSTLERSSDRIPLARSQDYLCSGT